MIRVCTTYSDEGETFQNCLPVAFPSDGGERLLDHGGSHQSSATVPLGIWDAAAGRPDPHILAADH